MYILKITTTLTALTLAMALTGTALANGHGNGHGTGKMMKQSEQMNMQQGKGRGMGQGKGQGRRQGQGKDQGNGQHQAGEEYMPAFMAGWDSNEDGIVSLKEASDRRSDLFAALDGDDNQSLSSAEFKDFIEGQEDHADEEGGNHKRAMVGMSLEFNDQNKDGSVRQQEFIDQTNPWLARMDRNNDGKVTLDDFGRGRGQGRRNGKGRGQSEPPPRSAGGWLLPAPFCKGILSIRSGFAEWIGAFSENTLRKLPQSRKQPDKRAFAKSGKSPSSFMSVSKLVRVSFNCAHNRCLISHHW
jgi:hypothetical protein